LAEMLGWCDEQVCQAAWGESYFEPKEMQQESEHYRILVASLRRHWGDGVAALFERAWRSDTLADCPTFGEWLVALPASSEQVSTGQEEEAVAQPVECQPVTVEPVAQETPVSEAIAPEKVETVREVRAFMQAARRMEERGNLNGAWELYRQAQELAAANSALRSLAHEIALTLQDLEVRRRGMTQETPPQFVPKQSEIPATISSQKNAGLSHHFPILVWSIIGMLLIALLGGGILVLLKSLGLLAVPITLDNLSRITQVAHWEQERVLDEYPVFGWSPRGTWLTVRSTSGQRLYSGDDFTTYRLIETGANPVISPDETQVASVVVSAPGTIHITDLQTGKTVREWQVHPTSISNLWFVGNTVLSHDDEGTLCVSDITTDPPRLLLQVDGVQGNIYISSDGKFIIEVDTASDNPTTTQRIRTCYVSEGSCETFSNDQIGGLIIDFSDDFNETSGRMLLLEPDGTLLIQEIASGRQLTNLGTFTDINQILYSTFLSPHGTYAKMENKIVRISDGEVIMDSQTAAQKLGLNYELEFDVGAFSPDERYFAFSEMLGSFYLINLSQKQVTSLGYLKHPSSSFSWGPPLFRPDGERVAIGLIGIGGQVGIFNTTDGSSVGQIDIDLVSPILNLIFDREGRFDTISGATLQTRTIPDGRIVRDIPNPTFGGLDFDLAGNGIYFDIGDSAGEITYRFVPYDPNQPSRELTFNSPFAGNYSYTRHYTDLGLSGTTFFAFSDEGQYLIQEGFLDATGSDKSVIALYQVGYSDPSQIFTLPEVLDSGLSFSPDNTLLAMGLENKILLLQVTNLAVQNEIQILEGVTAMAFSPDSERLAISAEDGKVYLWQRSDGSLIHFDTGNEKSGNLAFSPDGQLLAVIVKDGVQVWHVGDVRLLHTLVAPEAFSVAFSPDQKILAIGSRSEAVYLWGIRPWWDIRRR